MHRAPLLSKHSVRSFQHTRANVAAFLTAPARPPTHLAGSMAADSLAVQAADSTGGARALSAAQQAHAADGVPSPGVTEPLRDGTNGATVTSDDFSSGLPAPHPQQLMALPAMNGR